MVKWIPLPIGTPYFAIWEDTANSRVNLCSAKLLSYIGFILTNQPKLIIDFRADPSLHWKHHHQFINTKLHLQIEYPPSYTSDIWNYEKNQFDLINKAITIFDRNELFVG